MKSQQGLAVVGACSARRTEQHRGRDEEEGFLRGGGDSGTRRGGGGDWTMMGAGTGVLTAAERDHVNNGRDHTVNKDRLLTIVSKAVIQQEQQNVQYRDIYLEYALYLEHTFREALMWWALAMW